MSTTPGADQLQALVDFSNETTGGTDATLSEAVATLISGYGSGGGGDIDALIDRSIESVTSSASIIGSSAFVDCSSLTSASFPNATAVSTSGFNGCSSLSNLSIPNLTTVGNYAFNGCSSLTSAEYPYLTSIGNNGFSDNSALTTLDIPLCSNIGNSAFYRCSSLTLVCLQSATGIGNTVFRGCTALVTADLGTPATLYQNLFYGCSNLSTIILRKTSVTALANVNAFTGTPFASGGTGGTIYVPSDLISSYQSATNWSTVDGYGTITWVAIEGSDYENYYADGTAIS